MKSRLTLFVVAYLLIIVGCATGQRAARVLDCTIDFTIEQRPWHLGFEQSNPQSTLHEYVLDGQTVHNWSELVTTIVYYENKNNPINIKQLVATKLFLTAQGSKNFKHKKLIDEPERIVFEWSHQGSDSWRAQRCIESVMHGPDGIYLVSYAVYETAYAWDRYLDWQKRISNAKLRNLRVAK